jgi:hypothetical protein
MNKLYLMIVMVSAAVIATAAAYILKPCLAKPPGTALFKSGNEHEPFAKARYFLSKADLNKAVSPHKVYFFVATSGDQEKRRLDLIVTLERPSTRFTNTAQRLHGQIRPYMVSWQIRDDSGGVIREWEPHFENRTRGLPGDDYLTTIFSLSDAELRYSRLVVYFEDVNGDGIREDAVYYLDMTAFDWSTGSNGLFGSKQIVQ